MATVKTLIGNVKGEKGDPGDSGVGISSITKTATSGLVDTYTITLTNGNKYTFTVTNGSNGASGTTTLADLGITASADELNYVDGVKSNIQTQLDGKQNKVIWTAGSESVPVYFDSLGVPKPCTSLEAETAKTAENAEHADYADSAVILQNGEAGSASQPVYFTEGVPQACAYKLNKTVPSDAVFTDTTYTLTKAGSLIKLTDSKGNVTSVEDASSEVKTTTSIGPTNTGVPTSTTVFNFIMNMIGIVHDKTLGYFTFCIDGDNPMTFAFEVGMTWEDFVRSTYNTKTSNHFSYNPDDAGSDSMEILFDGSNTGIYSDETVTNKYDYVIA